MKVNGEWSLDALYAGYDDEKLKNDVTNLDEACARIGDLAKTIASLPDAEALRAYVGAAEAYTRYITDLSLFSELKSSTNTRDMQSASFSGQIMAKASAVAGDFAAIEAHIAKIDGLDDIVSSDEELRDYAYLFHCLKEDSRYLMSPKEEEILARMNTSGARAWSDLQAFLTSSVPVEYQGKVTNLSDIRNMAYSPDAQVRKSAYEAEIKCYDRIRDAVAWSLNSIKQQVIDVSRLRGYDSPLHRTLQGARMQKKTLDALMGAIEDYGLGVFQRYLKLKARALGHEKGLPWYDLFAPMGGSSAKYTVEDAKAYLVNVFSGFAPDLADMVSRAFDEAWIDFYPRDGKTGGAFCAGLPNQKQARILTNFDGSFSDIVTLAHELGHAYHDVNIFDHRPLNREYSMPVAETASTFNENVVVSAAIRRSTDKDEKLALIESQLMDACQIICDIYSRYTFESAVFAEREARFMSADDFCGMMLEAQKKAYGDALDPECLHPYMWVCKSHYYSGGLSFYNFPYAFGGLFARGLYAMYEREGAAFVPKYRALLRATTVMSVEDTARTAGIDLTDKAFWMESLRSFEREVDEFEALLRD